MKLRLTIIKPTEVDVVPYKGDTYIKEHELFEPLILELGKNKIIGQDTDE